MSNLFLYWEQKSFFSWFDVIIIGNGIVGLSASIYLKLKQSSLKIGILESGFLPAGAGTKNAGFGCFGSISELEHELKYKVGRAGSEYDRYALQIVPSIRYPGLMRF